MTLRVYLFAALHLVPAVAGAQLHVDAPRGDHALTPLKVYANVAPATAVAPAKAGAQACAPLALISPGAGGSEEGYEYLAKALRDDGWRAVVMGHRDSGRDALKKDVRKARGLRGGLMELTTDPSAYESRMLDIAATLKWAQGLCAPPFKALLGHSMGAATVTMEAGASNKLGVKGGDRFDAYVAMSPQGPGSIFQDGAWSGIRKPMLMLTGTRDKALEGGWESRKLPFDGLPGGCQWLGVIDGATHMHFAGHGGSAASEKLVLLESKAFLDGLRDGKCPELPAAKGIELTSKRGGA